MSMKNKNNLYMGITFAGFLISYTAFCIVLFTSNNPILLGIFGVLIMGCLFATIIYPLISPTKMSVLGWIHTFVCFFSFIILASAFISSIEDDNLRNTLIAVVSSSIGGLLTLFGVGITVKYARLEKKEEEIRKSKPYTFIMSETAWNEMSEERKKVTHVEINKACSIPEKMKGGKKYKLAPITVANSDASICQISGLLINKKLIKFKYELVMLKSNYYRYVIDDYTFKISSKIESIYLLFEDVLQNKYAARVGYTVISQEKGPSEIIINSIFDTNLIKN